MNRILNVFEAGCVFNLFLKKFKFFLSPKNEYEVCLKCFQYTLGKRKKDSTRSNPLKVALQLLLIFFQSLDLFRGEPSKVKGCSFKFQMTY